MHENLISCEEIEEHDSKSKSSLSGVCKENLVGLFAGRAEKISAIRKIRTLFLCLTRNSKKMVRVQNVVILHSLQSSFE